MRADLVAIMDQLVLHEHHGALWIGPGIHGGGKPRRALGRQLAMAFVVYSEIEQDDPHASVDEAIKAVPQGSPRLNMSNDVLHAPLLDLKRYDKCKVPRSTKVSMNVAVYDGVAVGVDVTTKPKNSKIEECLDGIVRSMTWDKVPSLNQVTVNF